MRHSTYIIYGFPAGAMVKNPPARAGGIRGLGSVPGLGSSLEEGMAIHPSVLAWRIPWTEEPGELLSIVANSET